jgi:hypothetical protein
LLPLRAVQTFVRQVTNQGYFHNRVNNIVKSSAHSHIMHFVTLYDLGISETLLITGYADE